MAQQTWTHFKPLFPIQPSSEQVLNTQSLQLAQDAIDNAIARYQPNTSNLMFHSDQGTQYSSTIQLLVLKPNQGCWLNNSSLDRF
jgi:hypothetical protein